MNLMNFMNYPFSSPLHQHESNVASRVTTDFFLAFSYTFSHKLLSPSTQTLYDQTVGRRTVDPPNPVRSPLHALTPHSNV